MLHSFIDIQGPVPYIIRCISIARWGWCLWTELTTIAVHEQDICLIVHIFDFQHTHAHTHTYTHMYTHALIQMHLYTYTSTCTLKYKHKYCTGPSMCDRAMCNCRSRWWRARWKQQSEQQHQQWSSRRSKRLASTMQTKASASWTHSCTHTTRGKDSFITIKTHL